MCLREKERDTVFGYKWETLQWRRLWKISHYLLVVWLLCDVNHGRSSLNGYFRKAPGLWQGTEKLVSTAYCRCCTQADAHNNNSNNKEVRRDLHHICHLF